MTIKEVSERFGVSTDTLRYYERIGLIPQIARTAGGIRDYTESDISWVEHTICMRNAGVPIEALIEYIRLFQMGDATFEARCQLLKEQYEQLDDLMSRKNRLKTRWNAYSIKFLNTRMR